MGRADDAPYGQELGVAVVHHAVSRAVLDDALARLAVAAPRARVVLIATGPDAPSPSTGWPPGIEVVKAPNRSYSHAVNRGLALLGDAPILAFMNDDVLVRPETFRALIAALAADPGAGVAGPVPLTTDGRPQDLGVPYRAAYARARRSGVASVTWLAGCLTIMTREAYVATGGYDESFRFTNEDIDFCLRAGRLGYRSLLVDTAVTHLGGTSTPSHPAFHVEGRRGGYLITKRHLPPVVRALHRAYLVAEGTLGGLLASPGSAREAHRRVRRMALTGSWAQEPFGLTLDER